MNKPWDNEPTPFKDQLVDEHGDFFISQDTVENLERRMRHAEKLLEQLLHADVMTNDLEAHLEAARQEDGR